MKLKTEKPIAFFDIEATGTSPTADRIVELSVIKLMPGGDRLARTWRVDPQRPIPAEVTKIHGISDEDIAGCPTFPELSREVYEFIGDADLAGYNVLRYDIPMLVEEFLRAEIGFNIDSRRIIDVQRIFHRREPRDLSAALAFYCGEMHLNAHGAEADVLATIRVLEGQFEKYPDLPADIDELSDYCNPRNPLWVDRIGRLKWENNEVVLNFSRKKGTPLKEVIENDPGFIKWMLRSDFPRDTRQIVENAAQGAWPEPPSPSE
jgi:DNA polymerase-3 subunit epsilon